MTRKRPDTDLPVLELALGLPVFDLDTELEGIVVNDPAIHPERVLVLFDDEDDYYECGDGSSLRPRLDTRLGFMHVLGLWSAHVHKCFSDRVGPWSRQSFGIQHSMGVSKLWELAHQGRTTDEDRDNLAGHVCAWKAERSEAEHATRSRGTADQS